LALSFSWQHPEPGVCTLGPQGETGDVGEEGEAPEIPTVPPGLQLSEPNTCQILSDPVRSYQILSDPIRSYQILSVPQSDSISS